VADDGGARLESTRESGLLVAGGGGTGAGSSGEARALEGRGRGGAETGGRVEQRERGASGSVAARQRGKEEGKGGGAVGPDPDWRTAPGSGPSVALAGDVRRVCIASGNREGRGI
jgi:hypothetical protein